MMEKRVILAIVLCVGILFAWAKLFPPPAPSPAPAAPSSEGTVASGTSQAQPGNGTNVAAGSGPAPSNAAGPAGVAGAAANVTSFPERETVIDTEAERFVFSNHGAILKHAQLRDRKYLLRAGDPASGEDLVRTKSVAQAPFRISFPGSGFPTPADTAWQVVDGLAQAGSDQITYRAETSVVVIEKRFVVDKTRYRLHLDVTVENRSSTPQDHHLAISVFGQQDPETKGSFLSGTTGNSSNILCLADEAMVREDIEKLGTEPFKKVGAVGWIGADEKFFLLAAGPYPETPPAQRECSGAGAGANMASGTLSFAGRQIAPGGRTRYAFAIYVGPKVIADLEHVRPDGKDVKLAEAVDVSLAVISRPMLWLLNQFHRFAGNWGLAIIMLTIFIRLLTFYPTQKSLMSAKKMQKLGPKMAVIRKKYEGDKQRQSAETMKMYKQHGVSPFGGCLPSLIQMPIWIALYSTLNYAVELYRSPFVFHIVDLTAKDPYYVTPLLMGGVMFIQMKMSPTSADNQQQAMMAIMMPVMFTAFSLVLPSGLAVYMLTSYLIGILQQLWINHLDRKASAPTPAPGRA